MRALGGRWHLLRQEWHQILVYGVVAVSVPQLAFFYAVQHLSVGVALLLEYLGLVLVVAWQCVAARRLPRPPTVIGIVLALIGLALVLDLPALGQDGGLRIDGIGVVWGLIAAVGLGSYFLLSGHTGDSALPPMVLAGGGLMASALVFAVLGATGLLPMTFETAPVALAGVDLPWWVAVLELGAIAAATAYVTGILAARVLGAKLASFVGLSEVVFAVLFAWVLLGELPRAIQLLGGLFILGGVIAVRGEETRVVEQPPSALEAGLALGVRAVGDGSVVADDRVELDGVDVPAPEHERRAVGAVEHERPL